MKKTYIAAASILGQVSRLHDSAWQVAVRFLPRRIPAALAVWVSTVLCAAHTVSAIDFQPSAVPADNIRNLVEMVRQAAERGAVVIVLPEHAIDGPLPQAGPSAGALWEMSSSQAVRRFGFLAKELRVYLVLTVPERAGDDVFTTTRLFNPGAYTVLRQNKLRPRAESGDGAAQAGRKKDLQTTGIGVVRAGVSSGADLSVTVPRLAQLGADTILVSASWTPAEVEQKRREAQALASAHYVNLVISNLGCGSAVISREGQIVALPGDSVAFASLPDARRSAMPLGLPADPAPRSAMPSEATVRLGRKLFADTALSSDGRTSCESCHNPAQAFTDGRSKSAGVFGRRGEWNTRTLLNSAFYSNFGWQGIVETLEQKVLHPFGDKSQMELAPETVVTALRARADYVQGFGSAFQQDTITMQRVAASLAAYVRTLYAGNSPFDRFRFGADLDALGKSARRGMFLFTGKAGCSGCHRTAQYDALFTDNKVHHTGIGSSPFLTPALRNIALTAPYMHDGSVRTLEDVVAYYDRGGNPNPDLDQRIRPLRLNAGERADLVEFLKSLTGEVRLGAAGRGDGNESDAPGSQDSGEAPERPAVVKRPTKTPRKDKEVKCAINNHREQQPSGCS